MIMPSYIRPTSAPVNSANIKHRWGMPYNKQHIPNVTVNHGYSIEVRELWTKIAEFYGTSHTAIAERLFFQKAARLGFRFYRDSAKQQQIPDLGVYTYGNTLYFTIPKYFAERALEFEEQKRRLKGSWDTVVTDESKRKQAKEWR